MNLGTLLLDQNQISQRLQLSPRTLETWRRKGKGPKYVRVSPRCVRYRESDIQEWLKHRLRQSTAEELDLDDSPEAM